MLARRTKNLKSLESLKTFKYVLRYLSLFSSILYRRAYYKMLKSKWKAQISSNILSRMTMSFKSSKFIRILKKKRKYLNFIQHLALKGQFIFGFVSKDQKLRQFI